MIQIIYDRIFCILEVTNFKLKMGLGCVLLNHYFRIGIVLVVTGRRSACHSAKSLFYIMFMNILAWGPQVSIVVVFLCNFSHG